MAGSAPGSSEKYAGKQASQASGSVPHQIIVNGFPNSKSNGTAPGGRSYHNSGAMSSGGSRAAGLRSMARPRRRRPSRARSCCCRSPRDVAGAEGGPGGATREAPLREVTAPSRLRRQP